MSRFSHAIRPHVEAELRASAAAESNRQAGLAFTHLERAHILGQGSTVQHVRVHWRMFLWGARQGKLGECLGQLPRVAGAATLTALGLVPHGNTGGSKVSSFQPMPLPPDLDARIQEARGAGR
jgi:Protein of unknown function (DUF3703)